jgi:hypothetical protein
VFDAQGWIYVRPRFKVQRSEFNDSRNKNLHLEKKLAGISLLTQPKSLSIV